MTLATQSNSHTDASNLIYHTRTIIGSLHWLQGMVLIPIKSLWSVW